MNVRPLPRVSSARTRPPTGWRDRLAVAARTVAALLGGYALAAFFTTTVALLAHAPREEAAMRGAVPSFLVFAAAVVWAFTARTAARAWAGISLPLLVLATLTWWLSRSTP